MYDFKRGMKSVRNHGERRNVDVSRKRRQYTYITEEEIRKAYADWEENASSHAMNQELEEANRWAAMHGIQTPHVSQRRGRIRCTFSVRQETSKRENRRRFRPVLQLASVLIILFMGGWYMQTDPVRGARVGIMDLLVGQHRDKYVFQMEHGSEIENWKEIRPGYIPEGFELVSEEESLNKVILNYSKEKLFIDLMISTDEKIVAYVETSGEVYDYIYLPDGNVATVYKQNDVYSMKWILENVYIVIIGNISEDVLYSVVESIGVVEVIV
jgi:hypothetical protein